MFDIASVLYGALGGTAAALVTAKLLAKWLVQHQLDKALKDHEARLNQKAEYLRTQLSILAHEQNVAVTRVDAQRAQALHAVFSSIRKWETPVLTLVAGSPLRGVSDAAHLHLYRSICEEAHAAAGTLLTTITDNAIYVDRDLYAVLVNLSNSCGLSIAKVLVPMRQGAAEGWSVDEVFQATERRRQLFIEEYSEQMRPAIDQVAERFRSVLRVHREAA